MPKIIYDQFEKKDCVISFALTRKECAKFDELRPKNEKQSQSMRAILADWINRREEQQALLKDLSIASI
jgi:hypothetical protein